MTLDQRIEYWRGRARLARRFGLTDEVDGAEKIALVLVDGRKAQRKAESAAERLIDGLPEELQSAEG